MAYINSSGNCGESVYIIHRVAKKTINISVVYCVLQGMLQRGVEVSLNGSRCGVTKGIR